jgi:hypothetical protein
MKTRRILLPLMFMVLTILCFGATMVSAALDSNSLIRLSLTHPMQVSYHHGWFYYCLMHPAMLKTVGRGGMGASILSSTLTLASLCKGASSAAVREHIKRVGRIVIIAAGIGTVLFLPLVGMIWYGTFFIPHSLTINGSLQAAVNNLLIGIGEIAFGIGIFSLVGTTIIYTTAELYVRLRSPVLAV